jgi:excisionase family DNA binding protein
MNQEYIRPSQATAIFGIKADTARRWFSQGRMPGARIGKTILINATELRARIQRVESGEPWELVFSPQASLIGHYSGDLSAQQGRATERSSEL